LDTVFYLHGFHSSDQSHKAIITRDWCNKHYPKLRVEVPLLPNTPDHCLRFLDDYIPERCNPLGDKIAFIGSSMGGFLANYLAERYGCAAVLINPAVYPHRLLMDFLGPQVNPYTGVEFSLDETMVASLESLLVTRMQRPERRMVLLQTNDEVLDYREAESYYASSNLLIEQGGDHSFQRYERHLPAIARFLEF